MEIWAALVGAVVGFLLSFCLERLRTQLEHKDKLKEIRRVMYSSLGTILDEAEVTEKQLASEVKEKAPMPVNDLPSGFRLAPLSLHAQAFRYYFEREKGAFLQLPEFLAFELVFHDIESCSKEINLDRDGALKALQSLKSSLRIWVNSGELDVDTLLEEKRKAAERREKRLQLTLKSTFREDIV